MPTTVHLLALCTVACQKRVTGYSYSVSGELKKTDAEVEVYCTETRAGVWN
ncbi:hypothetical protein BFJ69_g15691 [Fusarium oxysporum]|uniref:Uncharacterized protein n=1 Tax=Fusarium oxysporum TaxID=5507 RepID=A0A420MDH1_FUSOX|nr:hypothetical protein BFJ69_g15691 [Fusarium oxysporum]